jgi:flagellar biosynthesis protein
MSKHKKNNEIKKAVALRYKAEEDNAPVVIASGKGEIAEKILEAARNNNIPIREEKDLAEVLAQLEIGEEIPPELYQIIAEILSFIYNLEKKQL